MKKTRGIIGSVIGMICSAIITFLMFQTMILIFAFSGGEGGGFLEVILIAVPFVSFVFNIIALIASVTNKARGLVITSIVFNIINVSLVFWMVFNGSLIWLLFIAGLCGAIILQILSLTKPKNNSKPVPIKQSFNETTKTENEQTEEIDDKKII